MYIHTQRRMTDLTLHYHYALCSDRIYRCRTDPPTVAEREATAVAVKTRVQLNFRSTDARLLVSGSLVFTFVSKHGA